MAPSEGEQASLRGRPLGHNAQVVIKKGEATGASLEDIDPNKSHEKPKI